MGDNAKLFTRVYELPKDEAARIKFIDGITALAEECKATFVAGSAQDEMAYADLLAEELGEHIGEMGVEEIRQKFERKAK